MRVLFLTQTFPRFAHDSAGPFIRDLARGLVRQGVSVRVLIPRTVGVPEAFADQGVEVRSFPYAPRGLEVVGYGRTLRADEGVRFRAAVAAPLYLLGARRALLAALRREAWDLVHVHWIVPNGVAAVFPRVLRVPFLVGLHGSDVFLAESSFLRPVVRRILRLTAGFTACSPEFVARLEAVGGGALRSAVIPYGVDSQLFFPGCPRQSPWREQLGIPASALVVLAVGRMATKKGFQVLFDVLPQLFSEFPELHVVVAGGGDRYEEFRRLAQKMPPRIHLPGPVLHDALPELYRAADLFVLPAVHDPKGNVDGLPNVILEAMASGLPVVASSISGIPLAVVDGQTGRLLKEGDREALFRALVELVRSPELRQAWGRAARERAVTELSWDRVAGRYLEFYEETLKGLGAPARPADPRAKGKA